MQCCFKCEQIVLSLEESNCKSTNRALQRVISNH